MIYVIGEGQLLEQGTHNELLSANGAYARLVQAQKLRDSDDAGDIKDSEDVETAARKEVPLGRRNTGHSLASEIMEQKKRAEKEKGPDHSISYLFLRMGKIIKESWRSYLFGSICAICTSSVQSGITVADFSSDGGGLSGIWTYICKDHPNVFTYRSTRPPGARRP